MRKLSFLALAAALLAAGCDDEFGPSDWSAVPDTVALFSLSRPEYQLMPSALNIIRETALPLRVVVESPGATGQWDLVLTEEDGVLRFAPAGAFGIVSTAAIAVDSTGGFDALTEAPGDTAVYLRTESVPASPDVVYVVRSRQFPTFGGVLCVNFAKFRTVEIDEAEGTLSIEVVNNPNCNNRSFVPPDGD